MTTSHIQLTGIISDELAGSRIDIALHRLFPQYSRTQLQKWLKNGSVKVNHLTQTEAKLRVAAADQITVETEIIPDLSFEPQSLPLDIIYEDPDLIIINKPVGLVTHPGAGNHDHTLMNALLYHYPELASLPRAGIIHRLDKNTSGLLVIARNSTSYQTLVSELQARTIKREYRALVCGRLISGGELTTNIGRHPVKRTLMTVLNSGGKIARTHYYILQHFRYHTYLQVILDTGRTHQIRVHMSYLGFPLVGDPDYNRPYTHLANLTTEADNALLNFKHQALHAIKLTLKQPSNHELLTFTAPLPNDFAGLLKALTDDLKNS